MAKSCAAKSPRRSPRSPRAPAGYSPRSASISKAGTPTTAPRRRALSVLSLEFDEAELVAIEQEGAFYADGPGELAGVRPDGREAPALVDSTSPPRAVFKTASDARSARLKTRTSCMKLSNKDAFKHVERLGCPSPPGPNARQLGNVEDLFRRPLSRQSSLSSIAWGPMGESGITPRAVQTPPSVPKALEASVETPPNNPGAYAASELERLCRAPQQSRETLVSRSSNRGVPRAASSTAAFSTTASSAATAAAPFPRRPVWGELAHVPAWDFEVAHAQDQLRGVAQEMRGVAQEMRGFFPIGSLSTERTEGAPPSVSGSRASRTLSDDSASFELAALGASASEDASGSQDTTASSQDPSASLDASLPFLRPMCVDMV